jgi:hypothetical protein
MAKGSYWAAAAGADGQVAEWVWRCEDGDATGVERTEEAVSEALDQHLATHDQ